MRNPRIPPAVGRVGRGGYRSLGGFRGFLIRGNLVELAVAFVIGVAFAGLVRDFTTSFIVPLIALLGGEPDLTRLSFTVQGIRFPYGLFVTSAVAFFITALVVYYLVVLPTTRLIRRLERGREATERECPQCLSEIPVEARRCRFCTSEIVPRSELPHQSG